MGPPPIAALERFAQEEEEDPIDLASLDWDDREQVTLARSPSTPPPMFPVEDDDGDAAVTVRQRALSSSEATAMLGTSEDSVPSLASLRARVQDSEPPLASDDERTRPLERSWLSALANEKTEPRGRPRSPGKPRALKAVPPPEPPPPEPLPPEPLPPEPLPPEPLPPEPPPPEPPPPEPPPPEPPHEIDEGFDARATARKRRATPLPPSRSAVMEVTRESERPPRKDPDASAALPLVRRSVILDRIPRNPPPRVALPPPRSAPPPPPSGPPPPRARAPESSGRWIHQLTSERDDLWREIAQLRRWTRLSFAIATLALMACAVMAAKLF